MYYTSHESPKVPTARVESAILSAIERAERAGHTIAAQGELRVMSGKWRVRKNASICPITAVLIGRPTNRMKGGTNAMFADSAEALGVEPAWIDMFLTGYGAWEEPCGLHDDAWNLGMKFREKYLWDDEFDFEDDDEESDRH